MKVDFTKSEFVSARSARSMSASMARQFLSMGSGSPIELAAQPPPRPDANESGRSRSRSRPPAVPLQSQAGAVAGHYRSSQVGTDSMPGRVSVHHSFAGATGTRSSRLASVSQSMIQSPTSARPAAVRHLIKAPGQPPRGDRFELARRLTAQQLAFLRQAPLHTPLDALAQPLRLPLLHPLRKLCPLRPPPGRSRLDPSTTSAASESTFTNQSTARWSGGWSDGPVRCAPSRAAGTRATPPPPRQDEFSITHMQPGALYSWSEPRYHRM